MTQGHLHIDDHELAACVACGLCLPHCPTYRVTGEESASPRGRIAAMRAVHFDGRPLDDDFTRFMDLCVQCRACEAVCPSSVPFGHLMDGARDPLARRVMSSMPGDAPVLVDSAGCGAALEDYGHLVGTREAERFAARVQDVSEWLAPRIDQLPAAPRHRRPTVAVQDPCHLQHVQK